MRIHMVDAVVAEFRLAGQRRRDAAEAPAPSAAIAFRRVSNCFCLCNTTSIQPNDPGAEMFPAITAMRDRQPVAHAPSAQRPSESLLDATCQTPSISTTWAPGPGRPLLCHYMEGTTDSQHIGLRAALPASGGLWASLNLTQNHSTQPTAGSQPKTQQIPRAGNRKLSRNPKHSTQASSETTSALFH